ncbi:hypothetical protein Tco_1017017 [Tanacetum coccineum]|uniref:Uncharacterized protein n=1 Tax=Tanacetum coccineum TaxID=301880 RepID=A0ABQ5FQB4_9ASTR
MDQDSVHMVAASKVPMLKPGVSRPKIEEKDSFKLKGQFLKELRENTFSGSDNKDANEHIEKVLEIVDLFHVPNITVDQLMLRVFPISLTGATSRWLRNKPTDQEGMEQCKGPHYTKDCPLKEEGKTLKKNLTTRNLVDLFKEGDIEQQLQDTNKRNNANPSYQHEVLEDMDVYRDDGMGDVIFGEPFLREIGIKTKRFEGIITLYKCDEGDDLLTRARESNLYTISISDMAASSPVCLMSKATSTKSCKDHLCSACERGKSKKYSHQPNLVPSTHSKLELLHMDLYGPMRVETINGKKLIEVQ